MKLRFALIIFLLVVISVIITLNLFFYQTYEAEMTSQINQQQQIIAKTIAVSIDSTLEHFEEEIQGLAGLLASRGLNPNGMDDFIGLAFEELNEDIAVDLQVFDEIGSIVFKTGLGEIEAERAEALFTRASSLEKRNVEILITQVGEGEESHMRIYAATPIRSSRFFLGVVVIAINVDDFNRKFLVPIKTGERGYAWIMDSSGTLLYHPSQSVMVGRNIIQHNEDCFRCHESFKTELNIINSPDLGFSSYVAPYGEDKLIAFARTTVLDWIVCVSIPHSEVTSSIRNSMRLQSLLVLSIFISTVMASFLIIVINRERVQAVAKAEYADKVRQYATELEEVVQQRTRQLLSEKEKLDAVITSIGAGLSIFDSAGKCVWLNQTMQEWLSEELRDEFSLDLLYRGESKDELYNAVVNDDQIQETLTLDLGRRQGVFQMSISPFRDPEGEYQTLLMLQDITQLRQAEEKMLHSDKLDAMSRLSAGVAHEIGNPLTSISSYVQILSEMEFDDFATDALKTIARHIHRIENILRKMSVISRSRIEEERSYTLHELVDPTVDLVRYDKRSRRISITVDIDPDLPMVRVNGNQVIQVIMNIMLNAADAMDETGTLSIRAYRDAGEVCLEFKDTGHGMDEATLKKIFDPFYTTKATGTGLGLAVSNTMVRSFGGRIDVTSEPGVGSIFTVRLPAYEGEKAPNTRR